MNHGICLSLKGESLQISFKNFNKNQNEQHSHPSLFAAIRNAAASYSSGRCADVHPGSLSRNGQKILAVRFAGLVLGLFFLVIFALPFKVGQGLDRAGGGGHGSITPAFAGFDRTILGPSVSRRSEGTSDRASQPPAPNSGEEKQPDSGNGFSAGEEINAAGSSPGYNIDFLARAVAIHETGNCTTGIGPRYKNCFGIKRGGRFVRYETPAHSYEDFKRVWEKYYGRFPTKRDAVRWTGNDRPYEWLSTVVREYQKQIDEAKS